MVIACASGKGGTGKTIFSTSLALALSPKNQVVFVDADVEVPNAHIFLRPEIQEEKVLHAFSPEIISEQCDGCGVCAQFCSFSALTVIKGKVLFFPELCHGCSGCRIVCPKGAIREMLREKGLVRKGIARHGILFFEGRIRIGEPRASFVITRAKEEVQKSFPEALTIIDAPPGAGRAMVEAVSGTDFCILVTEPTPFGLSDLKVALATVREIGVPCGVVINKAGLNGGKVRLLCREKGIPVLGEIPYRRDIAENYARGLTLLDGEESFVQELVNIFQQIQRCIPPPG